MAVWPTTTEAREAIKARIAGVWDNPSLVKLGPLLTTAEDLTRIKRACLEAYGYTVGDRDPRANTNYAGRFMVIEAHEADELPTKDGRNGPWCVVGDNLNNLIARAYEALVSMVIEEV